MRLSEAEQSYRSCKEEAAMILQNQAEYQSSNANVTVMKRNNLAGLHCFSFSQRFWDYWVHCGFFENRVLLMYAIEGVSIVTILITAYEES